MKKLIVILAVSLIAAGSFAAALSDNRDTPSRALKSLQLTVKNDEVIYAGGLVSVDSNGEAVNATTAATDVVVGRAQEYVDNSADGETVNVDIGTFGYANAGGLTDADIGGFAYVVDNQTVTNSGTCIAGVIVDVDSNYVWVNTLYSSANAGAGAFTTISASGAVTLSGALNIAEGALQDSRIVSADIKDGVIVNADVKSDAAIERSKLSLGGSSSTITYLSATATTGAIYLADGVVTNFDADVSD